MAVSLCSCLSFDLDDLHLAEGFCAIDYQAGFFCGLSSFAALMRFFFVFLFVMLFSFFIC